LSCTNLVDFDLERNSKIYVAGHSGLIGSALVRRLKSEGFENLLLRQRWELDLCDQHPVTAFFEAESPDYVILAAGRVGGIVANDRFPGDFIAQNLAIQLNVMTAARHSSVKRLIFLGSSCMYPASTPQPMHESQLLCGRPEQTSIAYALAKLAGVQMCLAFNQQERQTRFVPIIPNSVYGPFDNLDSESGHVLASLVRRLHDAKENGQQSITLWGSGEPRREFIHSDDLASAIVCLLNAKLRSDCLPLNIGSGNDISIKELAAVVAEIVGYEGVVTWDVSKPDGALRKLLDSGRIRSMGWSPGVSLRHGIANFYDWFLANPVKT